MEYLSLKPNREILNAGFNSYHLGTESLEVKSLNLLEPVAYYPLTEEHYSYSHLRAHTAQNLLILDRWNEEEDTLYFIDKTFSIMGVTYNKENKSFNSPIKLCQFPTAPSEKLQVNISPSLSFPSSETCLFNDGAGKLYLISTGSRESLVEKQHWSCEQSVVYEAQCLFYLCNASTDPSGNIRCTIMSLEEEKMSTSGQPKVSLHCLDFVENNKNATAAADQFVCSSSQTFVGASVPTYVSQAPDFSALIIASEGEFKIVDRNSGAETPNDNNKNTNGKVEDQNGQQNDTHQPSSSMVIHEPERQSSAYTGEQIEECDMTTEEDFKLSVLDKEDGKIILQTPLSGHQWLFNVSHNPAEPLHFCVRHDVDGLLWKPVSSENKASVSWKHVTTFNAIGYIQASKKNQRFVTCSQKYGFVAIVDCIRNIYVYVTKSISDNQGSQYIIELPTSEEVLGVRASSESLFVLTSNSLYTIHIL